MRHVDTDLVRTPGFKLNPQMGMRGKAFLHAVVREGLAPSALDQERAFWQRQGVDFAAPDEEVKARLSQIEDARARFAAARSELDAEHAVSGDGNGPPEPGALPRHG